MNKKIIAILLLISITVLLFSGCFEENERVNNKPSVQIRYPYDGDTVSKIVTISGIAFDPDGDETLKRIEIMIDEGWNYADGTTIWNYNWKTFDMDDGFYTVHVRAWDGADYSEIEEIERGEF